MPQREVIEYVDEKEEEEELPDVQMYDTGRFDDSQDNIKSPIPHLGDGFNNLQDSIFIAKKNSQLNIDSDDDDE